MEDDLGWDYFGPEPMTSPRMTEHMDWHADPQNRQRLGNYGERFLTFHKQYIDKFDAYRISRGFLAVSAWDPATKIPPALSHDKPLMAGRATDFPAQVDPGCATPSWATLAGGSTPDPLYGYTRLGEFLSRDQLGRSIDSGWHGLVHNTIGGDMSQVHSPIDPIFWRWHRWIDNVRAVWELARQRPNWAFLASVVQVLIGVTNDAPGFVITPDGHIKPVPGGPGDPMVRPISGAHQELLAGLVIHELAGLLRNRESRESLEGVGRKAVTDGLRALTRD